MSTADCLVCSEKEQRLRHAVLDHWRVVRSHRPILGSGHRAQDLTIHETQVRMIQAEDSYRLHLRVAHEKPAVSTFTRFYLRNQWEAPNERDCA